MIAQQLTLPLAVSQDATFYNFFTGANEQALHALKALVDGTGEPFVYIWGPEGSGVSHLVQACCHRACERQLRVIFLCLSDRTLMPEVLQNLECMDVVCLDDVGAILTHPDWEESLLHLYNRVRDNNKRLVIGAQRPPALNRCVLEDLQSRLSWGLTLSVHPLNDDEKLQALQQRASQKGLVLSEAPAQFLIRHYSRNTRALFELLDILDRAAWVEQRKLTIPFIKKIML